ncbi:MAG: DNA repair protein RecN [Deltaproteobacteria bacterium]|nr:DNA repair protein RecN [Deltaproteobacteria bacterium]
MLLELRIKNLAILDQVELLLEPGFNVFTGETGAGKSMIVQAVHLLLGARGSEDLIRTGAAEAEIEARFETVAQEPWASWLAERDIPFTGELLLRRVVSRSGRSRSYLNDQAATLKFVTACVQELLHLSGQHEYQNFLAPENHLAILDLFAGLAGQVQDYRDAYGHWRRLQQQWRELQERRAKVADSRDLLTFQVQELEKAKIRPDEEEELSREQERLRHATQLWEAARLGYKRLYGDRDAILTELAEVKKSLEFIARFEPEWSGRAAGLGEIFLELEDVAFSLRDYFGRVHPDPARLEEIDQRLHLLQRLKRKYGPTLVDVLDFLEQAQQELAGLDTLGDREAELLADLEALGRTVREKAVALSRRRQDLAPQLAAAVEREIHGLAMPQARFLVRFLSAAEPATDREMQELTLSASGCDTVEFFLAPNPGEAPKPLHRIASGGELSRLVLGLKNILAAEAGVDTSIFDEVDAGIGGRAATVVGQKLQRLARKNQIICITHLPQIACFADTHFRVEKKIVDARTVTVVHKLDPEARLLELARMLGGALVSDATLAHAREMLAAARQNS